MGNFRWDFTDTFSLIAGPDRDSWAFSFIRQGSLSRRDLLGSYRLDLLGWRIKHSDVVRMGDGITIDLWLGSDRFDSRQFNILGKEE